MKFHYSSLFISLFAFVILASSCDSSSTSQEKESKKTEEVKNVVIPIFNADSAYKFVAEQVAFGPRVPNTKEHIAGGLYLEKTLKRFTPDVLVQEFQARAYNGTVLNGKNFIAQFNKEKSKRVLLAAHWDSRPYADHDPDEANYHTAIDGANDGASGVGVLMELARLMSKQAPDVGVDIVFFDLEDYGMPRFAGDGDNESWALGSQHWANNPMPVGYNANFGILLDMVGAQGIIFKMEHYSMYYAPHIVKKVWKQASLLGYDSIFLFEEGGYVMDDHIPVNQVMGIPMIDIIHYHESSESTFFPHWHTVNDNMDAIDKSSLRIVGETVTSVVYYE
ncbi:MULTISPECIES: M28 family peptidase [unclassified Lentimicrobium]|uniref:M28 family peptidase n=1 Tax=unclassified Lentimicrobium TaxID=2677434 RepID=UPI00155576EE|nr:MULTISPECIES: M28 family peptidase [unclassified Lentimicrobium]NPD45686.1 M28 family peptidase [Lentimicrobium sp. S6]NPD85565.1 M28 family peptidase [Lentimicrobium sp. L6]